MLIIGSPRSFPLDAILVSIQVAERAVALAHGEDADRPLRPGQLAFLDQAVERGGGFEDGGEPGGVVACTGLEDVTQREDLFGAGAVSAEDRSADVWILASVVAGIHVGPNLYRAVLQQLMQVLLRSRGNRETDQRCVALIEGPAIVSEGVDPVALI
jgi:hypothetical protein